MSDLAYPHAVRWATGHIKRVPFEYSYTKWHAARNVNETYCGQRIKIGGIDLLPQVDDEISRVDCKQCLSRRDLHAALDAAIADEAEGKSNDEH